MSNTPDILESIRARVDAGTITKEQGYDELQRRYLGTMQSEITYTVGRLVKSLVYVWLRDQAAPYDYEEIENEAVIIVEACLSDDEIVYSVSEPEIDRIATAVTHTTLAHLGLV